MTRPATKADLHDALDRQTRTLTIRLGVIMVLFAAGLALTVFA